MKRSPKRTVIPRVDPLEGRELLSGNVLQGVWIGQDQHDLVGPSPLPGPSGVQDVHIALTGLEDDRVVEFAAVRASGGGEWLYQGPWGPWAAAFVRTGPDSGGLFIEPYQLETGRTFQVELRYDDGSSATTIVAGGNADPTLRMPESEAEVIWIGQGSRDWVGLGAAVGPDGIRDAQLVLTNLAEGVAIDSILIDGPPGISWRYGLSQQVASFARLDRAPGLGSAADLYINPDRDLAGQELTLLIVYANGTIDTASVTAGTTDPNWRVDPPPAPPTFRAGLSAEWVGQDGMDLVGPGDVHLALRGLPAGVRLVGAVVSEPSGTTWVKRLDPGTPFHTDPYAMPLGVSRSNDAATTAHLTFPPVRDTSGDTLTVRLIFEDGSMALAELTGAPVNLGLRAARPSGTSIDARPGDDLNDLANRYGTVTLTAGEYLLDRPLALEHPVIITAEPGATIRFKQPANAEPWTAAIKIHAAHTTLDGFAVRFDGPVVWDWSVPYGPAVIGTTDDRDGRPVADMVELAFTDLDLESPAAGTGEWEEAPRLLRLVSAQNGRIEGNTLKGGSIEVVRGPWRIAGNDYRGTVPNTFANAVIAGHQTRDLDVVNNVAEPRGPSGKTWRFLVLTDQGSGDLVAGNTIRGIGPRANDVIPDANAPEIILTESYRLRFEGHPLAISADGRLVQIPEPQGETPRAGDVVAILSGSSAGQWRRIVQAIDARTYLLDAPLPAGDYAISIAPGFVGETFRDNLLDTRGGPGAANLILAGNHFGTRVIDNHFLGSGFRIFAAATEYPEHWGWSHAPMLGLTISGNLLEDTEGGASIAVEHGPYIRPNQGRVYLSGSLLDTTVGWSETFLASNAMPPGLTIGDVGSTDPAELVLTTSGNQTRTPGAWMRIHAGRVDGTLVVDQTRPLPLVAPAAPGNLRLVRDTGTDARDQITSDGRVAFDPADRAVSYEYRVGSETTYRTLGGLTTFLPIGLRQGANTVAVRAVDAAGTRGPEAVIHFILDTIAPQNVPPILTPESDTGSSNTDRITAVQRPEFTVTADAGDLVVLRRGGVPVASRVGPGRIADPGVPPQGAHGYSVSRTDLAGNVTVSRDVLVTFDRTPPGLVENLERRNDGSISFRWTGIGDVYEYRVNGGPYRSLGSATAFLPEGLAPGVNVVEVRAIDLAGNIGPARAIEVDVPNAQPTGTWLGQDGHDLVGPGSALGPDGIQDIHIALSGLDSSRVISQLRVNGLGGGGWTTTGEGAWRAALHRAGGSTTADLYVQPYQVETGRPFWIDIQYTNGTSQGFWIAGGTADPGLAMPDSLSLNGPGVPKPSGQIGWPTVSTANPYERYLSRFRRLGSTPTPQPVGQVGVTPGSPATPGPWRWSNSLVRRQPRASAPGPSLATWWQNRPSLGRWLR